MTTPTQIHTPTPWRVGQTRDGEETFIAIYNDPEQVKIARVETWIGEQERAEAEANAALIVRAVNSHAALVAACEAAIPVILDAHAALVANYMEDHGKSCEGGCPDLTVVAQLRAALALANGEQP